MLQTDPNRTKFHATATHVDACPTGPKNRIALFLLNGPSSDRTTRGHKKTGLPAIARNPENNSADERT